MSSCKKDPDPRNILTNAQKHLGCRFLINMDMEDFFHTVSINAIEKIFLEAPFNFNYELSKILAALCCHQDRLPRILIPKFFAFLKMEVSFKGKQKQLRTHLYQYIQDWQQIILKYE